MSKRKPLNEKQLMELIEAGLSDIDGLSDDDNDDYGWGDREQEVSSDDDNELNESSELVENQERPPHLEDAGANTSECEQRVESTIMKTVKSIEVVTKPMVRGKGPKIINQYKKAADSDNFELTTADKKTDFNDSSNSLVFLGDISRIKPIGYRSFKRRVLSSSTPRSKVKPSLQAEVPSTSEMETTKNDKLQAEVCISSIHPSTKREETSSDQEDSSPQMDDFVSDEEIAHSNQK
ncbi:unnamed protein product [Diabrotica balteata]|uniref:Uncharacterized protein n=1 Tax=Diabrotica balteata TaxID=107213 RepID=A0A9N9XGI7_DIABA|nr:unnamed protein product [Diabrotica balteata]